MALTHNSTPADSEPQWSSVNKSKLPRNAFADHGEDGLRSTYKYPHHWVRNGAGEAEDGSYTSGDMYLHRGGLNAAWSAAMGGRSGQEASVEVKAHLQTHRRALGMETESHVYVQHHGHSLVAETPQCWANHMGLWCIEPGWFSQAFSMIQQGLWQPGIHADSAWKEAREDRAASYERDKRPYQLYEDHVAIIPIQGMMMKAESKFGGVGTVQLRRMIRQAAADRDVHTLLLHVDSPGGHVAGTQELADELYNARKSGKDLIAHIDDLGASAAYWVASQTNRITANATAEIGSIGTFAVLEDSSGRMEKMGVKVHLISTGQYKGLGANGIPITNEDLDYMQQRVADLNSHFLAALTRGRSIQGHQRARVSDGRVYIAEEAQKLGLIDNVQNMDQTLAEASRIPQHAQRSQTSSFAVHHKRLQRFRHQQGV